MDFLFSQLRHLKLQNSTFLKSSDKGLKAQRHMIKQWQPFIAWFSTYLIRLLYHFMIALRAKFELVSVWPNFGKIGRTAMPLQLEFEISEKYCVQSHWKFFAISLKIILAHCYNSFTLKCINYETIGRLFWGAKFWLIKIHWLAGDGTWAVSSLDY